MEKELKLLIELLSSFKGEETFKLEDKVVTIYCSDEGVYVNMTTEENVLKDKIICFKELIDTLEDSDFIEIIEELAEVIDINHFNELLKREPFTKDEIEIVEYLIKYSTDFILEFIDKKIAKYQELKDMIPAE